MAVLAPRLTRCQSPSGQVTVRLGDPLLDAYLEFLEARWVVGPLASGCPSRTLRASRGPLSQDADSRTGPVRSSERPRPRGLVG